MNAKSRLLSSSLVTIVVVAAISLPCSGFSKEFYVYRERDGTRWISDHWLPPDQYAYIGKYGRPTAVLSCRGLKNTDLDQRAANYEDSINLHAGAFGVDPALVKAVMRVESCFDQKAVSRVGAQGLMQLMPFTARELGVRDSFDPDQNIRGGTQYLSRMLTMFSNNRNLALAAYNAGPGAVAKHNGVPPYRETKSYLKKVLAQYDIYRTSRARARVTAQAPKTLPQADQQAAPRAVLPIGTLAELLSQPQPSSESAGLQPSRIGMIDSHLRTPFH